MRNKTIKVMSLDQKARQFIIMIMMIAGSYGLAAEWGGDKTQPLFWIMFICLGVVSYIIINTYRTLPEPKKKGVHDKDHQKIFSKRMQNIMIIADENMKSAQYGKTSPVRDTVLVLWDDLLNIWDIAEQTQNETPVER